MEERHGFPVGEPKHLPPTAVAQTPLPLSGGLVLLNNLKVWEQKQKPCHDMAFLLVLVKDSMGDRQYGLSIKWMDPSQVRADSMEELVRKPTTYTPIETDWLYTLVQLHEGTCHTPLPREGYLGILPQRGSEAVPYGQISQLEVCQLLVTGPQVIYPVGLNGQDKPIITSIPEPLASGISLTSG